MEGKTALILLYSIFWANMLNSARRYRPFDTNDFFSDARKKVTKKRFFLSFGLLSVVPFVILVASHIWLVKDGIYVWEVIKSLLISFSLFGYIRILHSIVATNNYWEKYYVDREEYEEVMKRWGGKNWESRENSFRSHLIPGLAYFIPLIVVILIVIAIGKSSFIGTFLLAHIKDIKFLKYFYLLYNYYLINIISITSV